MTELKEAQKHLDWLLRFLTRCFMKTLAFLLVPFAAVSLFLTYGVLSLAHALYRLSCASKALNSTPKPRGNRHAFF